jgi:hypothetical protein
MRPGKWIGLAFALQGCATEAGFRSEMLTRVAFELGCPADQVSVTGLGNDSWGVSGCGKKAVYMNMPRVGYVNNTGVQRDGQTPPRPAAMSQALQAPPADEFVVVPLRAYLLRAHGDASTAFAAEVPSIVEQVNRILEPAGVYFRLDGPPQTVELAGEVPRQRAALKDSLPSAQGGEGFRLFFVRDLDANGAGLGGGDVVVLERPGLRRVDGASANPAARVAGHVLAGALGLATSRDEAQLMANGTTGTALDVSGAKTLHAAATQVRGAKTLGEAARTGAFPDAVAIIRARVAISAPPR